MRIFPINSSICHFNSPATCFKVAQTWTSLWNRWSFACSNFLFPDKFGYSTYLFYKTIWTRVTTHVFVAAGPTRRLWALLGLPGLFCGNHSFLIWMAHCPLPQQHRRTEWVLQAHQPEREKETLDKSDWLSILGGDCISVDCMEKLTKSLQFEVWKHSHGPLRRVNYRICSGLLGGWSSDSKL